MVFTIRKPSPTISIPRITSVVRNDTEAGPRFMIDTALRKDNVIILDSNITLGILKPDAIVRGLESEIYERIREVGLEITIIDKRFLTITDVDLLYGHHIGKDYYGEIVAFMTSRAVEIFLAEGKDAVERLNNLIGSTDPAKAPLRTLRRDYYCQIRAMPQFPNIYQNILHSSSRSAAKGEIEHFLTVRSNA